MLLARYIFKERVNEARAEGHAEGKAIGFAEGEAMTEARINDWYETHKANLQAAPPPPINGHHDNAAQ